MGIGRCGVAMRNCLAGRTSGSFGWTAVWIGVKNERMGCFAADCHLSCRCNGSLENM